MPESITEAVLGTKKNINIPLDIKLLLGDTDATSKDIKVKVRKAVLRFLTATCQDISI